MNNNLERLPLLRLVRESGVPYNIPARNNLSQITTSQEAYQRGVHLRCWAGEERECFVVMGMNQVSQPIFATIVSIGCAVAAIVRPKEVFRLLILAGAESCILYHNHPSGRAVPSSQDNAITRRLARAGNLLGIPVRDHIIIGGEGEWFSYMEDDDHRANLTPDVNLAMEEES